MREGQSAIIAACVGVAESSGCGCEVGTPPLLQTRHAEWDQMRQLCSPDLQFQCLAHNSFNILRVSHWAQAQACRPSMREAEARPLP